MLSGQVFMVGAVVCAGCAGLLGAYYSISAHAYIKKRKQYKDLSVKRTEKVRVKNDRSVEYAQRVNLLQFDKHADVAVDAKKNRSPSRLEVYLQKSGYKHLISLSAARKTQRHFFLVGLVVGGIFGALFSLELSILLAFVFSVVGWMRLPRALRKISNDRSMHANKCLPDLLDVIALGLRSGMTFDRSFVLYGEHFSTYFAQSCLQCARQFQLGMSTRKEALQEFSASYDSSALTRAMDAIIRSLELGTPMVSMLEHTAEKLREDYKAEQEEIVSKAPVHMMLPTATLILPAMMLLILGPIALELMNGF